MEIESTQAVDDFKPRVPLVRSKLGKIDTGLQCLVGDISLQKLGGTCLY